MRFTLQRAGTSLCLAASILIFAACASRPVPKVDYNPAFDFKGIKTLAFSETSASGDSVKAMLSDMEVSRISNALAGAIEAKGLQIVEDEAKADALINWHLVAQDKQDLRTQTTPSAYGAYGAYGVYGGYHLYNSTALYNCWDCGNTEIIVHDYTEGTFIVDIVDPTMNKSVWRSVTQSRLKGKMKEDPANYTAAAALIMADFPSY